jgi:hypothetical protein
LIAAVTLNPSPGRHVCRKGSEYQRVIDKLKVLENGARQPGCEKIHGGIYCVRSGERYL